MPWLHKPFGVVQLFLNLAQATSAMSAMWSLGPLGPLRLLGSGRFWSWYLALRQAAEPLQVWDSECCALLCYAMQHEQRTTAKKNGWGCEGNGLLSTVQIHRLRQPNFGDVNGRTCQTFRSEQLRTLRSLSKSQHSKAEPGTTFCEKRCISPLTFGKMKAYFVTHFKCMSICHSISCS